MKKNLKYLICLFFLFNLIMISYGVYKASVTVHVTGKVKTYEIDATPKLEDLGEIDVDQTKNFTIQVSNTGNQALHNLNMTVNNVVGLNSFSLSWDKEGITLNSLESVTAKFSLTVHSFFDPNFSFDVTVKGE